MKYLFRFVYHIIISVFFLIPYLIYHIIYFLWHFRLGEYPWSYRVDMVKRNGLYYNECEYVTPFDYMTNNKSFRREGERIENFYWVNFNIDEDVV